MSDEIATPKGLWDRRAEVQILDVREHYEWDEGRIDGSIHVPLNEVMAGAGADLDQDRPVVVVCKVGSRSELAALMLQARGFEAWNLEGGLEAWEADGLPLEADGRPGRVA